MDTYHVIGLMSGTSLDGLDIVCCRFSYSDRWRYDVVCVETIEYSTHWRQRLAELLHATAEQYILTHVELGKLFGNLVKEFIARNKVSPILIASHGHTIFHQPQRGFTSQIGDGAQIAAITGIDTVCDFRSKDVALHGQGAPLVPAGDRQLFSDNRYCLNLGGIANITLLDPVTTVAFDICPANMPMNILVQAKGNGAYDKDGALASKGIINSKLLDELNRLSFYMKSYPKSLGREWIEDDFLPVVHSYEIPLEDKLATLCEHAGQQISKVLDGFNSRKEDKLLITGGGAFNPVLVNAIRRNCIADVIIPDPTTIAFKEAIVFAFLGLLYLRNECNVLSAVTGSTRNHIGGALYKGA